MRLYPSCIFQGADCDITDSQASPKINLSVEPSGAPGTINPQKTPAYSTGLAQEKKTNEPPHQKTNNLHMRKQRRRSEVQERHS